MSILKTRQKLVDIARQLFAKNGIDGTTMNDIAVASGKGRRAAMEAALMMSPRPEAGEKVSYYICSVQDSKKLPDWKKARPVELYDSLSAPYDPSYYLKKIDDWRERFLPPPELPVQTELF